MPELPVGAIRELAGRELDAAVAEHVMGWTRQEGDWTWFVPGDRIQHRLPVGVWSPSTNPADCVRVIEKLRADERIPFVEIVISYHLISVRISFDDDDRPSLLARGGTIGEAVCRAALLAVRELDRDENS
jgi:hypothetical protein